MIDFKVHLENDIVSLVQTQENHFEGLYTVGMNPFIWEQHQNQDRCELNNFRKYIDDGLNNKEGCFTIIDKKINLVSELLSLLNPKILRGFFISSELNKNKRGL